MQLDPAARIHLLNAVVACTHSALSSAENGGLAVSHDEGSSEQMYGCFVYGLIIGLKKAV